MKNFFKTRITHSTILDAADNFVRKNIPLEVRTDEFTGRVSRILKFRFKMSTDSTNSALIEKSRKMCPFCPENLETSTPKFPISIAPEGRICFGETRVFPNAFPYSKYCGVVSFSEDHYIPLGKMTPEVLFSALKAGAIYIDRVRSNDDKAAYASINWNYMMAAGGGLVHPHLQVVISHYPTRFHKRLLIKSFEYFRDNESNYWSDFIEFEKNNNKRYLFNCGNIEFLSVFSPGGMFGEVLAIFSKTTSAMDITDEAWKEFAQGLSRILAYYGKAGMSSLNMTIFLNFKNNDEFWVQARITPRGNLPPLGTSDVNYFDKGHDEIIVIVTPEDQADEIRQFI